jgi:hypothetical protein
VQDCQQCGGGVEGTFRFCPWCAAPLRRKLVEFFPADESLAIDHGKALRVSRYLHDHHVRFSVWNESGVAEGAVSISEPEAARLARYLREEEDTLELERAPRPRSSWAARAGARRGA